MISSVAPALLSASTIAESLGRLIFETPRQTRARMLVAELPRLAEHILDSNLCRPLLRKVLGEQG
jgi:hypothetical protein